MLPPVLRTVRSSRDIATSPLHGVFVFRSMWGVLIDVCREELGEKLPPMSMYRILDFLEQEELVHKLKLANRYVACTHITCDHQHEVPQFLICVECYRVEETAMSKSMLDSLKGNVKKVGFELVSPQLEINCICGDCG